MADHIVIGGGVHGLIAAFALHDAGHEVLLLEADERIGGILQTHHNGPRLMEGGPQSLQGGAAIYRLLDAAQLWPDVVPASSAAHKRYLLQPSGLVALPGSLWGFLTSPLWTVRAALRAFLEPLIRRRPRVSETLYDFLSRRIGRGVTDAVADAFVAGIFGGDPKRLEVQSAFAILSDAERNHGSIVRGMMKAPRFPRPDGIPRGALTLKGGMETLPRRLGEQLGDRVRTHEPVQAVVRTPAGWQVTTAKGTYQAPHVTLAVGPQVANPWLDGAVPQADHAPMVSTHLFFPDTTPAEHVDGFGWLAPKTVRDDVLGCLTLSAIFPHQMPGERGFRVMIGGTRAPQWAQRSEDELLAHARRIVADVHGIDAEPSASFVRRHPVGIPQYALGHRAACDRFEADHPGLHLAGWWYYGVGLSHACQRAWRLVDEAAPTP